MTVFAVQKCAEYGYRKKWRSINTAWQQAEVENSELEVNIAW